MENNLMDPVGDPPMGFGDPELDRIRRELMELPDPPAPKMPERSRVSRWWETIKGVPGAALGGAAKGVVEGTTGLLKAAAESGLAMPSPMLTPFKEGESLTEWWERAREEATERAIEGTTRAHNAAHEYRQRLFGPDAEGPLAVVEGISQFAIGFLGAKKLLAPLNLASKAGKAGAFVEATTAGAVADMTAFDPYEDRLSNMVENGPAWLSNPVTRFLQADEADSQAEARVKAALEGMVLGTTIDGIVAGLRGLKAVRAAKAGKITPEEAQRVVNDAAEAVEKQAAKEPVGVMETPEGAFTLTKDGAEDPNAPLFKTKAEAESYAASMNLDLKNEAMPKGQATPEFVETWRRLAAAPDERTYKEILADTGFNFRWDSTPEEVQNMMKAAVDADPVFQALLRADAPSSWDEVRRAAESMYPGQDVDGIIDHAAKVYGDLRTANVEMYKMKRMADIFGHTIHKLNHIATANPDNPVAMANLVRALDAFDEFAGYFAGSKTGVGRALNILKADVHDPVNEVMARDLIERSFGDDVAKAADDAPKAKQKDPKVVKGPNVIDKQGPRQLGSTDAGIPLEARVPAKRKSVAEGRTREEILALSRQVMLAKGDAGQILLALRMPRRPANAEVALKAGEWEKKLTRWRMNAMLSGPRTMITNILSNAITTLQMPAEMFWAGVISRNRALARQGADTALGVVTNLFDSIKAFKKAWDAGDNLIDQSRPLVEGMFDPAEMDLVGSRGSLVGVANAPLRFLMATDEMFKVLNYRAALRAMSLRQLREQGVTDPKVLASRLADDMKFATDETGAALNPLALQYARTATFTNELEYGFGKWLQEGVNKHALFRFIMPFVRTPVNLFRFAMQRTPVLARFTHQWKEAIKSGDPERIAMVKAREHVGYMTVAAGAYFALSGRMTGGGPTDPQMRKQLKATGWRPYSVKIGDEWVAYDRMNPQFTLFGVIADIVQVSGEMTDDDLTEKVAAVVAATMASVSSKSFMQGVADFLDAMASNDGDTVKALMSSSAGSFIPNALRQLDSNDAIMETRSITDEMMARVPGFSEMLEPRRNALGERVLRPPGYFNRNMNPFTLAPGADEKDPLFILSELGQRLGNRTVPMPETMWEGGEIDATDRKVHDNGTNQSPYDRALQLLLPPEEGGRLNLKGRLRDLMSSPGWSHMTPEEQFNVAEDLILSMQQTAREMTKAEYPTLVEATRQAHEYRTIRRTSDDPKAAKKAMMEKYEKLFIRMR